MIGPIKYIEGVKRLGVGTAPAREANILQDIDSSGLGGFTPSDSPAPTGKKKER